MVLFFFFQAEDGIRDSSVTGVQTCALPKGVGAGDASTKVAAGGFSQALQGALQSVSSAQNNSSQLQREVQLENPAVSLEETMIAMQKAQIGFQATMQRSEEHTSELPSH